MTKERDLPFRLLECLIYTATFLLKYFTLHFAKKVSEQLELRVHVINKSFA